MIRAGTLLLLAVGLLPAPRAGAALPGADGRIAFVRDAAHGGAIFSIRPDGSGQMKLTTADDFRPAWSPDGSKIAFQRFRGNHSYVYVMNADGSHVQQLTRKEGFHPSWSPDGSKIVFGSDR